VVAELLEDHYAVQEIQEHNTGGGGGAGNKGTGSGTCGGQGGSGIVVIRYKFQ